MELMRYDEIGRLAAGLGRFIYRHIPLRCCGETEATHAGGVYDLFGEKDVKRKVEKLHSPILTGSPLKTGIPKWKYHLPTIDFQGRKC